VQLNFSVPAAPGEYFQLTNVERHNRSLPTAVFSPVVDPNPETSAWPVYTSTFGHPPLATKLHAISIGMQKATIVGTLDPHGNPGSYRFEFGKTSLYDYTTPVRNLAATPSGQVVSASLRGLHPGTTYHFRIDSKNPTREGFSPDATFRTKSPPCVVPKLTGKTVARAKEALRGASCSLGRVSHAQGRAPRGRVVAQEPKRGSHLRPGARVRVVISLGPRR
jgi:hypothetical protein